MSYFSNSSDGEQWMSHWCYRCVHDHDFHPGGSERQPCTDQVHLFIGEQHSAFIGTPVTITMASGRKLDDVEWSCINFARCSCDNGHGDPGVEPVPVPDPNQGVLFDADVLMPGVYRDVVLDAFAADLATTSVA